MSTLRETLDHTDLVTFAASRGGRLITAEFQGVAVLHRWACGRGHEFDASPRLLVHGGYWCPQCLPTVDDASRWDWSYHAEVDPLLASFHRNGDRDTE